MDVHREITIEYVPIFIVCVLKYTEHFQSLLVMGYFLYPFILIPEIFIYFANSKVVFLFGTDSEIRSRENICKTKEGFRVFLYTK